MNEKIKSRLTAIISIALVLALAGSAAARADSPDWKQMPVLPSFDGAVKKSFLKDLARSRKAGMRPKVFAKVGDSNTEMTPALYGLGCRKAILDGRTRLKKVIDRYTQVPLANKRAMPGCEKGNSFTRRSAAVKSGTYSTWSLETISELPESGYWTPPSDCPVTETPMSCEVRVTRPRYMLIMTGTNDFGLDTILDLPIGSQSEERTSKLISAVRKLGSVPIVSTLPPILTPDTGGPEAVDPINEGIVEAARKGHVPVINLWRALYRPGMENHGMEDPGLHLRAIPGGESPILESGPTTFQDSVDFRPDALRFGSNLRNLIWLKTLAKLDRVAGVPGFRASGKTSAEQASAWVSPFFSLL